MPVYRVLSASLFRGTGILAVLVEEASGDHGGCGSDMEVEGMNGKTVRYRAGRIIWNKDNSISARRILLIDPPGFPVEDLKGRRLLSES